MKNNVTVAICNTHQEAEEVVKNLNDAGFNMKNLSIIGKDYHEEDKVVGFYNTEDRVASWGKSGAFWGGIWGLIFGAGFFLIPGIGPVVLAGPIISSLVGGLEGALLVGGFSALGAALFSIGIPKDSVLKFETAIKADKFLVIANGDEDEIHKVKDIMKITVSDVSEHKTYESVENHIK